MAQTRFRIGFISHFFHEHTISRLHEGFISHLDRQQFHVTVIRVGRAFDDFGRRIDRMADDVLIIPKQLESARQLIAARELDLLYYTDLGMEAVTYLLAFSRLAPVQCTGWGHPLTTGIETIDYFISSELMEPTGAERHYSERLVRLSTLPTRYTRPAPTESTSRRAAFGLQDDEHVYLCPQSLFKLHPDYDRILSQILEADPAGRLVLLEGQHENFGRVLRERFARSMAAHATRVKFVPRQTLDNFLQLVSISDLLLDPPHFSGGNTSLEAFSLGKAVITLPGPFMRARVTYACYRQMGLNDCVAQDEADYVRLAVSLGCNPERRAHVEQSIREHSSKLFDNDQAVRELEQFFISAIGSARGRQL